MFQRLFNLFLSAPLTRADLVKICRRVKEGGEVLVGQNAYGQKKIKIIHGPFGFFVTRYVLTEADMNLLKKMLNSEAVKYQVPPH